MNKNILGLDLGTNSIGWALIDQNFEEKKGNILGMGSRIIPMSQDILSDFGKGNTVSQTAERTGFRGVRRLRERHLLRRERLHRVLNILGFLPQHYADQIDFDKRLGKFKVETEPKIAYHNNEFIFQTAFEEMLEEFRKHQPILLKDGRKVPYDWTIYYLRNKALKKKIEKEELAWLILNFNQKRGYYQLRGEEEEENPNKLIEFHSLKVSDVVPDPPQKGKNEIWYSLILENGWVYRRSSKISLDNWKDKVKDFIVTTDLNDDGSIKKDAEGKEKRSFRAPKEDDWTLQKKKKEKEIDQSGKSVGSFIYEALLKDPDVKIKGKLIHTIERKYYKSEITDILNKQKEFHSELQNNDLLNDCIRELYRNNEKHQLILAKRDFIHLFLNDIIFYQRPLKSKKSSISNCPFEFRKYQLNGEEKIQYLKAIPKSNPLYQEFRIWQWIYNLKILENESGEDATSLLIKDISDLEILFEFLMSKKEIDQKSLLKHFKLTEKTHRWNYVEDKKYPCNETHAIIMSRLSKVKNSKKDFLTFEIEQSLWHLLYSVTDKIDFVKALKSFAGKHNLDEESFVENFKRFPPFKSEYGAYSEKAIKKLLPLLRAGKYWKWDSIDLNTKERVSKLISGEFDEDILERVRQKAIHLQTENDFQALPIWLASYIVYDRHSEAGNAGKWSSASDLEVFLRDFKQHSLRNPIVEQVVTEALRVVYDIWKYYGKGAKDFFNEIHIELGRDMKNTADQRKRITQSVTANENTNIRIKALLSEFLNHSEIENVRPYSPMQQEILKIYEDGVLNSAIEIPEEIGKIAKKSEPTTSELIKYKCWLEQKYRSPYTGDIIPLSKLFTPAYEIEHIIPQSRFFDDGFNNKVICESEVNQLKGNQLGLEFIKNHPGEIVLTNFGKQIKILDEKSYKEFVEDSYSNNYSKRTKLLLEEIPDKMIERQLNDTRYISKFISSILSNIVRSNVNDDGVNSKNIIAVNGKITSQLKQDWGLNDVWNDLILPRFERMNEITNSKNFTVYNEKYQKYLPTVPWELSKGFQKKRIDHRHHSVDALIVASITRDHVNLLNNQHAKSNERFDLNRKLREFEKVTYKHPQSGQKIEKEVPTFFKKPWSSFTIDTKKELKEIVVSFKQNLRVINKATNKYEKWIDKDGKKIKENVNQTNTSWAIRKSLHKDTVSGEVKLFRSKIVSLSVAIDNSEMIADKNLKKKIADLKTKGNKQSVTKFFKEQKYNWEGNDVSKVEIYYWDESNVASRVNLDTSFNEKKIESITDTGIQKILLNHLNNYNGQTDENGKPIDPEMMAFTPEGIEEMNKNIENLNENKFHKPIYKVRTFEPKGNKFNVGQTGNKTQKFVEADKGTNLFFAVYADESGKRNFETIPLNEVIEHQIWRAGLPKKEQKSVPFIPIKKEKGKFLFSLSPNDLVYIPTELKNDQTFDKSNAQTHPTKIYKVVSFSGNQCFFIKSEIAYPIVNKAEFSALNKMERSIDGVMIKDSCHKMKVDRLGNIQLNNIVAVQ